MTNIYFAGSIRGGRQDAAIYFELIEHIRQQATVLTEHVGDDQLLETGEADLTDGEIYSRDMQWIHESRAIVAEVTQPSLGVGYELGVAESLRKPILCLFRRSENDARLSAMMTGNPNLHVVEYNDIQQAKAAIDQFLTKLELDTCAPTEPKSLQ